MLSLRQQCFYFKEKTAEAMDPTPMSLPSGSLRPSLGLHPQFHPLKFSQRFTNKQKKLSSAFKISSLAVCLFWHKCWTCPPGLTVPYEMGVKCILVVSFESCTSAGHSSYQNHAGKHMWNCTEKLNLRLRVTAGFVSSVSQVLAI